MLSRGCPLTDSMQKRGWTASHPMKPIRTEELGGALDWERNRCRVKDESVNAADVDMLRPGRFAQSFPARPSSQGSPISSIRECSAVSDDSQTGKGSALAIGCLQHTGTVASVLFSVTL